MIELKNYNIITLLIPWIFFPLFMDFNLLVVVPVFVLLSFLFFVSTDKKVVFQEDSILVSKYLGTVKNEYAYSDVMKVYFNIIKLTYSASSTVIVNLNSKKEKVTISRAQVKPLFYYLKDKKVSLDSNYSIENYEGV